MSRRAQALSNVWHRPGCRGLAAVAWQLWPVRHCAHQGDEERGDAHDLRSQQRAAHSQLCQQQPNAMGLGLQAQRVNR